MTTKEEILKRLRDTDAYLSGEQLSEKLGISRAAVWKAIQALRETGYQIDSVTNRGYRLTSLPDLLTETEIRAGLKTKTLGGSIVCLAETDSTNEEAKRHAQQGAPEGSLFVAEHQTGGKGRLGRRWEQPEGTGVWFSVLLRPGLIPSEVGNVTLLAGIAVCRAIRTLTGCEANIKWPNDVVIGSRKVCGILTEMTAEIDRIEYMVLGIGINANIPAFPESLGTKATSLQIETGKTVSRASLLQTVLLELELLLVPENYSHLTPDVLHEYQAYCVSLNRRVGFFQGKTQEIGTAIGISPTGELIVQMDNGQSISINAGEVVVQGIYGQTVPQ